MENEYSYSQKEIITPHESFYYNIFSDLQEELNVSIQTQVPLISVVKRDIDEENFKSEYPKELNRIIDFGVFSRDRKKLILLI